MEVHEDFDSTLWMTGYDYVYNDADPSPVTPEPDSVVDAHGMQVAGLIAAMHNNILPETEPMFGPGQGGNWESTAGVAPDCTILPMRIFDEFGEVTNDVALADAVDSAWESGAAVMNCSWGTTGNLHPTIVNAFNRALINGRGGKGCVVVASVGNNPLAGIKEPASLDSVISVGSIDKNDFYAVYSARGPELDLVAPSAGGYNSFTGLLDTLNSFYTVDREGAIGANSKVYGNCGVTNDYEYSCSFGKTSASAPLVAGIVALLLSVDNNLTRDQIQDILRASAEKDLGPGTIGPGHDLSYGYGRVSGVRAMSSLRRGDVDGYPGITTNDYVYLAQYMFGGGPAPFPDVTFGDVNCAGVIDISDLTYLFTYIFGGGPAPPYPCLNFF